VTSVARQANRSSRLAPRQLQPYHAAENPQGLRTWNMRAPVWYIWGKEDQMMPPVQVFRGIYLWPRAPNVGVSKVAGADHFVEIDQPEEVAEDMLMVRGFSFVFFCQHESAPPPPTPHQAINGTLGLGTTSAMLGINPTNTYKGDEKKLAEVLDAIYRV